MLKTPQHLPVLYAQALQQLNLQSDGIYIDATFGRGGHSLGILEHLNAAGRLLAFDRDSDAIQSEIALQLQSDSRFDLAAACFSQLETIVQENGWHGQIAGILFDLGVSSPQLDNPERGFSFLKDGALDMRMDCHSGLSAAQWLATIDEASLVKVLFEYGEERFARRIAKTIIETRLDNPITTTLQLANLISSAIPFREKHKHPATRSFQAIRIAINQELAQLQSVLPQATRILKPGGRLVVIAFHSLEDRIVKRFMRDESGHTLQHSRLPILESAIETGVLTRVGKAIHATETEIAENPRARSAIMRVAQKKEKTSCVF